MELLIIEVIMNKSNHLPRIIESKLEKYLNIFGAVCIEGTKWCGKNKYCRNNMQKLYFYW